MASSAERGRLVVISGPSGAGKSTIVAELRRRRPFFLSVSVTTRGRRPGELDGEHYHFVEREAFEAMVEAGALLEWAEYSGSLYGTPRDPVLTALADGLDVVLEIELQGAMRVRAAHPDALLVFVRPPRITDLETRLRARGDTPDDAIRRRLAIAEEEMSASALVFDTIVVNAEVGRTADEIEAFLDAHPVGGSPVHSLRSRPL